MRLTNFELDLGVFLASRGPYAWLGWGWVGCGCGWDGKVRETGPSFHPSHGKLTFANTRSGQTEEVLL
jgi:hypothetical protein